MALAPPLPRRVAATLQGPIVTGDSVSDIVRRQKEALYTVTDGSVVPLTGQYYDQFRATQQVRTSAPKSLTNPFVRGIQNKAGGVPSFAAATYQYPSGQMVIGAALAGLGADEKSEGMGMGMKIALILGLGAAAYFLVSARQ